MNPTEYTTIDAYIAQAAPSHRQKLHQLRAMIREAAPEAKEVISYRMPAFRMKSVLVYFAAAKRHIGFYPTGSGIAAFAEELEQAGLKFSKGAVQFPIDQPLPENLIRRMVAFRLGQDGIR